MDQKDRLTKDLKHAWQLTAMSSAFQHTEASHKNEVIRGSLWIGDFLECEEAALKKRGITHVVSINDPGVRVPLFYESDNIEYHRIREWDNPTSNLLDHFEYTCAFIHKQVISKQGRVLVHCQAGVSRSATICMAYLIKYHKLSFIAAYGVVKAAREIICPNTGFLDQLMKWEAQVVAEEQRAGSTLREEI